MKKKIYLILSVIATLLFFTTAAVCNQCTAQTEEEIIEEAEEESVDEKATEETEEEPSEETEEETTETEPAEEEPSEEAEEEVTEDVKEESGVENPQPELEETQRVSTISRELNVKISEVGYMISGEDVLHPYEAVQYIGDTAKNNPCRGYISYDISSLSGVNVESAFLELGPPYERYGDTSAFYPISIYSASWGARALNPGDFGLAGNLIGESNNEIIEISSDVLKGELQQAIDDGAVRFQIIFYFKGLETDNDNQWDGLTYSAQANGNFIINYTP
ncbi:hypothetical protein GF312_03960 [Candidatus Poribacteria bacterium]|nr:hypothetical protein [Candidatus Poribacteria bacterium]